MKALNNSIERECVQAALAEKPKNKDKDKDRPFSTPSAETHCHLDASSLPISANPPADRDAEKLRPTPPGAVAPKMGPTTSLS